MLALRRAMPRGGHLVTSCRSAAGLRRVLASRLVDAVVTTPRLSALEAVAGVLDAFSGIPRLMFAPFRPDDGDLLLSCREGGAAGVAVEGVDDPVLGGMIDRMSLSAERHRAMAEAPRVLRLRESLQRQVWEYLLTNVADPARTQAVAIRFRMSREHLSRQFGAGGAPNLKRVIDLTRIACAAQLLRNPGHSPASVARVLSFASSGHLSDTARRVAGVSAAGLTTIGPRGVLAAFVKGKMRSRV